MEKNNNLIVTLASENQINMVKQLFSSIYFNSGWNGDYMLLSYKIPEKKLKWFRKRGIIVRKCSDVFKEETIEFLYNHSYMKHGSIEYLRITLNKLRIFSVYFKKWDNVIYLDNDIIVRGMLDGLINFNGFYAVIDNLPYLEKHFINKRFAKKQLLKNKYNLKEKVFNSGLIAFNTSLINKNTFKEILDLYIKFNKIRRFTDQSILNLYFYKKWNELPIVYNINPLKISMPILPLRYNFKIKALVLHFYGASKPWNPKNFFYREWKQNFDKADLIKDFNKSIEVRKWSKEDIKKYSKILKRKFNIYLFFYKIDAFIGKIGYILMKICPGLYYFLKKKFNL